MPRRPRVLAKAATAAVCLATASCVSYSRYEATALTMEKYRALAQSRGDSLEHMRWQYLETYRRNDELAHETRLLNTELASTRTQYAQLEAANADVVSRYDRSLALSSVKDESYALARQQDISPAARRDVATPGSASRTELGKAHEQGYESYRRKRVRPDRTTNSPLEASSERLLIPNRSDRLHHAATHESITELLSLRELERLPALRTSAASLTDEGQQYVLRVSEALTFRGKRPRLTPAGQAILSGLADALYGRSGLELLVHPNSRCEGSAAHVAAVEREQAEAVIGELIRQGLPQGNVRVIDDAGWSGQVTRAGALGGRLDGEIVFVIRPRTSGGVKMQ